MITSNKNKLHARIILELKKVLDVWQFVHLKNEDYGHVSVTWGGRGGREKDLCGLLQRPTKGLEETHAFFYKCGRLLQLGGSQGSSTWEGLKKY